MDNAGANPPALVAVNAEASRPADDAAPLAEDKMLFREVLPGFDLCFNQIDGVKICPRSTS
ncbi:uncharacterized protein DFE_3128 [Desulfovibrio ferrophilus]|uniref:Uncharacterized protein n=1 Tax=Desulfovibrio ferrophilus TaxID=241368 RepID=A0A2Z6B2U6_9BACT|nr:uncharacterized protein DFE_3128 [Desulfovibrio ferrophilus]